MSETPERTTVIDETTPRQRDDESGSRSTTPLSASGAMPRARAGLWIASVLLLLGALPDAMVPPVLHPIVVERLGATETTAHWFMSVNLLGALAAIPLLVLLRKWLSPTRILVGAALADAILLFGIFLTENLALALWLRTLEGMADLILLAVLLDLMAKAGGARSRGRRMGLGATMLLLGLGFGALIGGRFGAWPEGVFLVGTISSVVLAAAVIIASRALQAAVASCPVVDAMEATSSRSRRVWPVVAMMAGDRALAGVLTVTIPLLLAGALGWTSTDIGWIIAVPLLLMAALAWPAGVLGDRIGNIQLRAVAGLVYAVSLALIPAAAVAGLGTTIVAVVPMGIAAAALMATTLALAARTGRGSVAMAAVHAGGNVGYLVGISGGGALLALVGGVRPDIGAYALVVVVFAFAHVVLTGMATLTLVRVPIARPSRLVVGSV